jgi:hypothetical protein
MIRFDDDDINLRRRNSIEKHRRRRIEKNRFPKNVNVLSAANALCAGVSRIMCGGSTTLAPLRTALFAMSARAVVLTTR